MDGVAIAGRRWRGGPAGPEDDGTERDDEDRPDGGHGGPTAGAAATVPTRGDGDIGTDGDRHGPEVEAAQRRRVGPEAGTERLARRAIDQVGIEGVRLLGVECVVERGRERTARRGVIDHG